MVGCAAALTYEWIWSIVLGSPSFWSRFMCGIIAYVGRKTAQPVLIEGLKRLEYRGYDSAGIAVIDSKSTMHLRKAVGRISVLEDTVDARPLPQAHIGISHTRWATHGGVTEANAHPPLY